MRVGWEPGGGFIREGRRLKLQREGHRRLCPSGGQDAWGSSMAGMGRRKEGPLPCGWGKAERKSLQWRFHCSMTLVSLSHLLHSAWRAHTHSGTTSSLPRLAFLGHQKPGSSPQGSASPGPLLRKQVRCENPPRTMQEWGRGPSETSGSPRCPSSVPQRCRSLRGAGVQGPPFYSASPRDRQGCAMALSGRDSCVPRVPFICWDGRTSPGTPPHRTPGSKVSGRG